MLRSLPHSQRSKAQAHRNATRAIRARRHPLVRLKLGVKHLYFSSKPYAVRFRYALLSFDVATILFFIASSFIGREAWVYWIDAGIGAVLLADYAMRLWLVRRKILSMLQPVALIDLVVIVSLFFAALAENLAFLRILRALRLLRSYHVLRDLRRHSEFVRENEATLNAGINLAVFVLVVTAVVYVQQHKINPDIANYADALYFTVASLTTTGYGDVTLVGDWGHLLSVGIMVLGISLFLRLAQTLLRSHKVRHTCPTCGLNHHDRDAIHCKHCGGQLKIETPGV